MRPEEIAYSRGYRVDKKGLVYNKENNLVILSKNDQGYLIFGTGSRRFKENLFYNIAVHRLQAFMKYGKEMYKSRVVRHLDENKSNNHIDNIRVGSYVDNYHDISKERRRKILHKMAVTKSSLLPTQIKEIKSLRNQGLYYREIAEKIGISLSWVCMIINNKTHYTKDVQPLNPTPKQ